MVSPAVNSYSKPETANAGPDEFQTPNSKSNPGLSVLTLALLAAVTVPQLGVGMTAPALPGIALALKTSISSAQSSVVIYMFGYAVSMLLAGLMSDRFGPRWTQAAGLAVAAAASILAAEASTVEMFYIARFLQAVGGCAGTITTRLIIRQEYEDELRMAALTMLSSVFAITPCIAPLVGAGLLPLVGWRGLFLLTAVISASVMLFFLAASSSVRPHQPARIRASEVLSVYILNLKTPRFVYYAAALCFVWMSYFAFVSCSSGPFQLAIGLSSTEYGTLLAFSAVGYVLGSTFTRRMSKNYDIDIIVKKASYVGFAGGTVLIAFTLISSDSVLAFAAPLEIIMFVVGMTIPATQAGLLRHVMRDVGVASGLFFFLEMIAGAAYGAIGNALIGTSSFWLAVLVALPAICLPAVVSLTTQVVRRSETPAAE